MSTSSQESDVKTPFNPYSKACPSRRLLNEVSDMWTVLILGTLYDGSKRFSELNQHIEGISNRMLTQTLRTLERDGILTRTQLPEIPPHVEYELTDLGRDLADLLDKVENWSTGRMDTILSNRSDYDSKNEK